LFPFFFFFADVTSSDEVPFAAFLDIGSPCADSDSDFFDFLDPGVAFCAVADFVDFLDEGLPCFGNCDFPLPPLDIVPSFDPLLAGVCFKASGLVPTFCTGIELVLGGAVLVFSTELLGTGTWNDADFKDWAFLVGD
jgi:hypothetical protein